MEIIKYLSPILRGARRAAAGQSPPPTLHPFSLEVIKERERERKQILNHHDGNPLFKKAPFATQKMNNKSSWSHERRGEKPLGLLDQQQQTKSHLLDATASQYPTFPLDLR